MRLLIVLVLTAVVAACAATVASARTSSCTANTGVSLTHGLRVSGGSASVSFTVAQGCSVQVSLVSYSAPGATFDEQSAAQQVVYQSVTQTVSAATTLTVAVPSCYYQVDLVYGSVIQHLGPAGTNNFYGKQGRLIQAVNGGTSACTTGGDTGQTGGGDTGHTGGGDTGHTGGGDTGHTGGGDTGQTGGGDTGQTGGETSTPPPAVPAPSITLVKLERVGSTGDYVAGPLTVHLGDTVWYRIVVTNTGTTDVSVNLTDAGCVGLTPTGPQGLVAGASLAYSCSHVIVGTDGASYTNTASATASNAGPVTATAQSTVVANLAQPSTTTTSTGGVLGASTTVKKAKKTVKHHKVKKVAHKAKAAKAVVAAGRVTG